MGLVGLAAFIFVSYCDHPRNLSELYHYLIMIVYTVAIIFQPHVLSLVKFRVCLVPSNHQFLHQSICSVP